MTDKILADRTQFLEIARNLIKREGIEELIAYLEKTDFFEAPASAKFHCDYEGGLLEHSINVYNRLRALVLTEYGDFEKYSEETIAICGLFHDLCKIEYYRTEMRNVKENGEWVKKPYYAIDEKLPYGHGEKSVYIVNGFMRITREEAVAINWHMGGFDHRVQGGNTSSIGECYKQYPISLLLHIADLEATYIDENSLTIKKDKDKE